MPVGFEPTASGVACTPNRQSVCSAKPRRRQPAAVAVFHKGPTRDCRETLLCYRYTTCPATCRESNPDLHLDRVMYSRTAVGPKVTLNASQRRKWFRRNIKRCSPNRQLAGRDAGGIRTHFHRVAAGCLAVWLQRLVREPPQRADGWICTSIKRFTRPLPFWIEPRRRCFTECFDQESNPEPQVRSLG